MTSEVKIFKLVSGEEVLAKVEEVNEGFDWLLTDARMLGMDSQTGQPAMMPFMMLNPERSVTIPRKHVMAVCDSVPLDMEKKYLSDTSGIALS